MFLNIMYVYRYFNYAHMAEKKKRGRRREVVHKEKFLKSVILFLKYIKYIYLYTKIPILFVSTTSIQIYILNIFLKKV